jgi:hypothetical protein
VQYYLYGTGGTVFTVLDATMGIDVQGSMDQAEATLTDLQARGASRDVCRLRGWAPACRREGNGERGCMVVLVMVGRGPRRIGNGLLAAIAESHSCCTCSLFHLRSPAHRRPHSFPPRPPLPLPHSFNNRRSLRRPPHALPSTGRHRSGAGAGQRV